TTHSARIRPPAPRGVAGSPPGLRPLRAAGLTVPAHAAEPLGPPGPGTGAPPARPRRRPGGDPGPARRAADARLRDDPGAGGPGRRGLGGEPGGGPPHAPA